MSETLSEHTLNTTDELIEMFQPTEELEEYTFDYGEGFGVGVEWHPDRAADKLVLKINEVEHILTLDSTSHLFDIVKLKPALLEEAPFDITVPVVDWWVKNQAGSLKMLSYKGKVAAFTKPSTEVYSMEEVLDTILKVMGKEYGMTEVHVLNPTHDMYYTQYTLLFPQTGQQMSNGEVMMSGLHVSGSLLGKSPLTISSVTARDYHFNAHISENLVEQWDRRRTKSLTQEEIDAGEKSNDVFEWAEQATHQVFKFSNNDLVSVKTLVGLSTKGHSGTILNDVLNTHSVRGGVRNLILENYSEQDGSDMIHLWNAITETANHDEIAEKPKLVKKLMQVGGALAAHPATCASCFRLSPELD